MKFDFRRPSLPWQRIFFTGISNRFPFALYGMAWTSNMNAGTCRRLRFFVIWRRISGSTSPSLPMCAGVIFRNRMTLSVSSEARCWPTQRKSRICSEKMLSKTAYISDEPKRTPDGFRTPSLRWKSARGQTSALAQKMLLTLFNRITNLRPRMYSPLVRGLILMKSPCVQTSVKRNEQRVYIFALVETYLENSRNMRRYISSFLYLSRSRPAYWEMAAGRPIHRFDPQEEVYHLPRRRLHPSPMLSLLFLRRR